MVILVYCIIPSNQVKRKFETCENWSEFLSFKVKTRIHYFKQFFVGELCDCGKNLWASE